jgi:hypothetical protein
MGVDFLHNKHTGTTTKYMYSNFRQQRQQHETADNNTQQRVTTHNNTHSHVQQEYLKWFVTCFVCVVLVCL